MHVILSIIQRTIEDAKAEQISMTAVSTAWIGVDYVAICSALSPIHLRAIYDRIYRACRDQHFFVHKTHKSFMKNPDWLYLIASDGHTAVLVHMMLPDARMKYDIDTLVSEQAQQFMRS